ncbi:hypothetical protein J6590_045634 [Homalodisca vitripennis]|nr:hypothetical protein J6590_045634 [Homalodisca vitripennis]
MLVPKTLVLNAETQHMLPAPTTLPLLPDSSSRFCQINSDTLITLTLGESAQCKCNGFTFTHQWRNQKSSLGGDGTPRSSNNELQQTNTVHNCSELGNSLTTVTTDHVGTTVTYTLYRVLVCPYNASYCKPKVPGTGHWLQGHFRTVFSRTRDLTSEKLDDLGRDLGTRHYRSEKPLAISADFGGTPHF